MSYMNPLSQVTVNQTRREHVNKPNEPEDLCWEFGTESQKLSEWTREEFENVKIPAEVAVAMATQSCEQAETAIGLWRKGNRCSMLFINIVKVLIYSGGGNVF